MSSDCRTVENAGWELVELRIDGCIDPYIAPVVSVPEPSTVSMLLIAFLVFALVRRFR
jgi:hypothetical protein